MVIDRAEAIAGQVALVTGATGGIGSSVARALAERGARLALVARKPSPLCALAHEIVRSGGTAQAFPADVTSVDEVTELVRSANAVLGPVDLLVNAAGVPGPVGPAWTAKPEMWWACVEANLRAPVLTANAVLPGMVKRGRGRIINVASGSGTASIPFLSAYVVSKTALIRFTEVLAGEVKSHGVTVFAVEPGPAVTSMVKDVLPDLQRWIPWLAEIFDRPEDLNPEPGLRLILTLAAGGADPLTGRFLDPRQDVEALVDQAMRNELGRRLTLQLGE